MNLRKETVETARNLILIGGTGRNLGKTTLAAVLIRKLRVQCPVNAAKIITVEQEPEQKQKGTLCPRGGKGCGACSLESDFVLCEECLCEECLCEEHLTEHACLTGKDTAQLLMAGANRVFLLRSLKRALSGAFAELRRQAGTSLLIAESNSLRTVVRPALFVMLTDSGLSFKLRAPKPSAQAVMKDADLIVPAPFTEQDLARILARLQPRYLPRGIRAGSSFRGL